MKRIARALLVLLLIGAGGFAAWRFRGELRALLSEKSEPVLVIGTPRPDPMRYEALKEEVAEWREEFAERYREAGDAAGRRRVVEEASVFLEGALPQLMACWLGTPWDFEGTAEGPGEEGVACGYFVATVLRDAGFRVHRYRLAKEPSQNILQTFVPRDEWTLRVGVPYRTYAAELRGVEPGVRIVGLDTHVGFLVTEDDGFRFIHSSGSRPWSVVEETEHEAAVLRRSNYRVQGSLTDNRETIRKWLRGERFRVVGR